MAYCSKCGVELDSYIKKCPLCDFAIPDIFEDEKEQEGGNYKYPNAIYEDAQEGRNIRNNIFFSSILIAVSTIIIAAVLKLIYPASAVIVNYVLIGIISALFYMFFFFGYLKSALNRFGIFATTLFLTYSVDYQMEKIDWFYSYAMPIILLLYIDLSIFLFLFKKTRNKNQFVYVPCLSLLSTAILSLGIDTLISYRIKGAIDLSWSIIVLICSLALSLIILGIYHGLSKDMKAWLNKKLHI